ncbi:transcriptional regulator FilR1 domain-containing protein [Halogranum rubrum]|uniref:Uncharacterized protein n=1 Tax=Halogranum salarium B-1 TaxID=1210908 RepID=J3JDA7_9EURY|nr:hypothetical protein [Halogranum salarium]EJN57321.1 hypothetical protein HSB1_42840 [Halogranum salarium B-1]
MNARELVTCFTAAHNSDTVPVAAVFRTLREDSESQVNLAVEFDTTRKTINQLVSEFTELGFITSAEDGYRLTGAGAIALQQYTNAADTIGEERLQFLVTSQNRVTILRSLHEHSARKGELASRQNLPSRSTVGRTIDTAQTYGHVTRTTCGDYTVTSHGEAVLETYDDLLHAFQQILDKTPCLQNLGVECAELPVSALDGEEMVTGNPKNPFTQRNKLVAFLDSLDETEIDHIRTFSSYFDLEISKAFNPLMRSETRMDVISPATALDEMPTVAEGAEHVKQGLGAENVHWQLYPGELPVGLLIVDKDWVVAGPKSVSDATEVSGTVYCSDPEIVKWAIDLHEAYMSDSKKPLEHLADSFRSASNTLLEKVMPMQTP